MLPYPDLPRVKHFSRPRSRQLEGTLQYFSGTVV
jgi:hypothetical protein